MPAFEGPQTSKDTYCIKALGLSALGACMQHAPGVTAWPALAETVSLGLLLLVPYLPQVHPEQPLWFPGNQMNVISRAMVSVGFIWVRTDNARTKAMPAVVTPLILSCGELWHAGTIGCLPLCSKGTPACDIHHLATPARCPPATAHAM